MQIELKSLEFVTEIEVQDEQKENIEKVFADVNEKIETAKKEYDVKLSDKDADIANEKSAKEAAEKSLSEVKEVFGEFNLKQADFWNNFTYIYITNLNWTIANETDWCSGSGTWSDPYLIENMRINASLSPIWCGILIDNSTHINAAVSG